MAAPPTQPVTLASLAGTWHRLWVRWPGGREDATTRVWWVQSARHYADLRIPGGRPSFEGVHSLSECSRPQLLWLATQQGFAGELTESAGVFHWWREVDVQPFTGRRDVGRLTWSNPERTLMTETGVDEPYTELWQRTPPPPAHALPPLVTRIDRGVGGHGWFVGVGNDFILAFDRRPKLPPAESLHDLVATSPPHNAGRRLNVEISFGHRDHDEGRNGTIVASTLPWREGQLAFPAA